MHIILDQLERNASERGGHPAVSDAALSLNYAELLPVCRGLAGRIDAGTDRPRVGVLAPTSSACAAAVLACWYAGRTPVPLNFLLAPAELAKVIRDADLDLVVTAEMFAPAIEAAGLRTIVLGPATMKPGRRNAPDVSPADLGVLVYTSGTSGDPKGVCLSFANLAENVRACVDAIHFSPDEVFLSLLPQFHAFGFTTNTLVPLLLGATVHYLPRYAATTVVGLIEEKRITTLITVASMFGALCRMKDASRERFASLRYPVSGGEPLPMQVARTFEERFGQRVYEGYGMTEASPVVSLNIPDAYRPGSVGRPLPGVRVTAMDAEGRELPVGEEGELVVRGHCVMQGYLNKPEQTANAIRDGGLWTGDVGRVDADGFVHITGRVKEMMIVGGENVFPHEIETALMDHPAVMEAAVVGMKDEMRGELPVAFVILEPHVPGAGESELRSFCRERLAAYKVPRQVRIAEELPRGPTGKILKRALLEQ